MPGFPSFTISQSLLKLTSWVGDAISYLFLFTLWLQSFPALGPFPMNWLFTSGGQSIGASASASILLMNIQGWFSLGLTGLSSLLSKRLSRVFSSTTIQKHQFFSIQPSLWFNFHIWWLRCWSFSFSISPPNECSGLMSCKIYLFGLLAVQGTLKSLL